MRRLLIATTLGVALLAHPAGAQFIVHDPASNVARIMEAGRAIQQAIQQYQQLQAQYNATARMIGGGNIAGLMGGLGRNSIPSAAAIQNLMRGRGTVGNAGSHMAQDQLYATTDRDEWAREMERREMVSANAKALAEHGMMDTEKQILDLGALQGLLDITRTVVDFGAIQSQISGHQANISMHLQQVTRMEGMIQAANRTDQLRAEQRLRRDADDMVRSTQGAVDSLPGGGPPMAAPGGSYMARQPAPRSTATSFMGF